MAEDYRSTTTQQRGMLGRPLPLILISIGVMVLVANAGPVGSVLWSVTWPIALVAVGADLITEGRQRRQIGILALIGIVVLTPLVGGARWMTAGRERVENLGQPVPPSLMLQDVDRVQVQVTQPAGDLRIEPLSDDSPDVARVGDEDENNEYSYTVNDRIGVLEIRPGPGFGNRDLELGLTQRVPLDLNLNLPTGSDQELNFENLQLEKLELNVSAGDASIKLPERGAMDITIAGGIGDLEIEVPDNLSARIEVATGIGDIEYDEDRFHEEDGVLLSNDYNERAANRATVHISSSAGDIEIK